jgi:hypothetical protein
MTRPHALDTQLAPLRRLSRDVQRVEKRLLKKAKRARSETAEQVSRHPMAAGALVIGAVTAVAVMAGRWILNRAR